MTADIKEAVRSILEGFDSRAPRPTADRLRELWFQFEPKSIEAIKAEQRAQQETVGIPVPVLKAIGKEVARPARRQVDAYLPLARLLWADYGREGRVVAVHALGAMELAEPETVMPLLQELCRTCLTWEDADQLAMNALEPIIRKEPEQWLADLEPWLADDNKWVRRAGITAAGRLPMKQPAYTARCVEMAEQLLPDDELEVKRAVSFAIRLCARGEVEPVRDFLARQVPAQDPVATWVLCDAIRSMAKKLLPQFTPLLPLYEEWASAPGLSAKDRRSVQSAVRTLQGAES